MKPILTPEESIGFMPTPAPQSAVDVGLNLMAEALRKKTRTKQDAKVREEIAGILSAGTTEEALKLAGQSSNEGLRNFALAQALGADSDRNALNKTQYVPFKNQQTGEWEMGWSIVNPNTKETSFLRVSEAPKKGQFQSDTGLTYDPMSNTLSMPELVDGKDSLLSNNQPTTNTQQPVQQPQKSYEEMRLESLQKEAEIEAQAAGKKKTAEIQAQQSLQLQQDVYDKIQNINSSIRTFEQAIGELEAGANVGIIDKYLPSFKASTVAFENTAKRMGLDIIATSNFGPLSEGEMKTAMAVAMPPNLDTESAKDWLQTKRDAQIKLRETLQEIMMKAVKEGKTGAQIYTEMYGENGQKPEPALTEEERQALDWANQNPDNPKAKQIKEALGF